MIKKISVTIFFYGYAQFIAFLIFVLTAKFYGVEGRGIYASVISFGTFTCTLLSLSIANVIPYFVIHSKEGRDVFFKRLLFTITGLVFLFSILSVAVLTIAYFVKPSLFGNVPQKYLLAGILSIPYFTWMGTNDAIFSSGGEIITQNKIAFINRTLLVITTFLLLWIFALPLADYLIIYGIFNLLQMTHELFFLNKKYKADLTFKFSFAVAIIKKGLQAHLFTIAGLLNTTFGLIVLNYYSKDIREVGDFNFAVQISSLLMVVPIVINRYFISNMTAMGINATSWQKQKQVMKYCLLIMLVVSVAAYFLITPFCYLVKKEFYSAIPLFRLLLLTVIPSSFCFLMQSQWYGRGYFKKMSLINIVAGACSAVISLCFVPYYKSYGAAAAIIFTYTVLFIVNILFFMRIEREIKSNHDSTASK